MTDEEIDRALRRKYRQNCTGASVSRQQVRKRKLRSRFKGRLAAEIRRTREKLELLEEIKQERRER